MQGLQAQIVHPNPAAAALTAMLWWARPYERDVYRVALALTGNQADADHVLLETVQTAWSRYVQQSNQRPTLFDALQIAVRESVAVLRNRAGDLAGWIEEPETVLGDIRVTAMEWEADPESLFPEQEWKKIRRLALETLTPLDRTTFVLCDVLNFSIAEASGLIERPEPVVKVRLLRARLRLREWLNPLCRKREVRNEIAAVQFAAQV